MSHLLLGAARWPSRERPLAWFPRVLHADPPQRQNWRLLGDGQGISWPDLDEDLSVDGLLRGEPAPGGSTRAV
ncbi:MAG TPA: DUF2442 domain-containing protein [Planctomycetota bacterium]|nr:DUF2442 domain-containing protein [Planctomycetota bacterium]